jgi:acyl-CoA dehydrogenase
MLRTEATRVAGGWSINGRKWFITGGDGAAFFIRVARTAPALERGRGATMFFVDADRPGVRIELSSRRWSAAFPVGMRKSSSRTVA